MGALDKPYKVIKFKNVQAISMQEGLFPAEPHHLDALVELDAKCFMPSSREETTTWRNQMAQTQVFLVRGKVIGAVVVHQNELHSLAVDPDHQRMGYGVVLVQKAIGQGASRLWVREQNQRAEALYKKCGFVRSSKVKTEDGTQFFEMVLSYSHLQPAAHIHGQPLQG